MLYSVVCIMYTIMTTVINDANDFFSKLSRLVESSYWETILVTVN